jgi:16S rRNA (guanine966-N2)-methyltransferase
VRIIGGAFRGRRLASLGKGDAAARLRPTPDRVRESLFSVLAGRGLPGEARVLDLFAGTGALGLEALSRGAQAACFVESGRRALALLRENLALCGVAERAGILTRDARRLGPNPGPAFDLVFLDPPYGRGLGEAALAAALAGGWIAPGATVVWEEGGAVTPPEALVLADERRYGDTVVRILERR